VVSPETANPSGNSNERPFARLPAWWTALLLVLSISLALPILGYGVTKAFVSDGLDQFASDSTRMAVAAEAVSTSRLVCLNKPGVTLFMPAIRVTHVERTDAPCTDAPGIRPGAPHYTASIRAYTLFGIPLKTFHAACNGGFVVCS
jgi:hypothetical protein